MGPLSVLIKHIYQGEIYKYSTHKLSIAKKSPKWWRGGGGADRDEKAEYKGF